MKILLVRYHEGENINTRLPESLNKTQGVYPPLGIAYIAAVLEKADYNVKILDVKALNLTTQEYRERIEKEKADVVGITSMLADVHGALEAAKIAKEIGSKVIFGGSHMSVYPKETMDHYKFIDYGVIGEGEYTILELVQSIEKNKTVKNIQGLVYREKSKVIVNSPRIVENLDDLPFPARHLLPMEKYHCVISKTPFTTIISSRGCPYHCGFCIKTPSDKKYRMRNPKNVIDEIEVCINKYKVKEIMFYDDTLTLRRSHIVGICNEILKRGVKISWESPTRLNHVDKELLILMKKAGCMRLRYGVESGDPRILKLMNKQISIEQIKKVFKWTKEADIEQFAYFIIGYYSDTPKSIKNTINLAKDLNPNWVMFTTAIPLPNTNLFDLSVKNNLIDSNYWVDFLLNKNKERIPYLVEGSEKWIKKAYLNVYFRPRFIINKLKSIHSWDTIKKYTQGVKAILQMNSK